MTGKIVNISLIIELPVYIEGTLFTDNDKGICGVHISHDPLPDLLTPDVLNKLPNYLDYGKNDVFLL